MMIDSLTFMVVIRAAASMAAIILLSSVAERMFPLRSVSRDRWEWDLRPSKMFPGIHSSGWLQIAVFSVVGLGIGGIIRFVMGIVPPRRLPEVLGNGVTRTMTLTSPILFDSERSSEIYSASWLRSSSIVTRRLLRPKVLSLMLRRIRRRGYLPILMVVVSLLWFSVGPVCGLFGRVVFLIGWGVISSAVWRATRLDLPGEMVWRWVIISILALTGSCFQWASGVPYHPVQSLAWSFVSIVYCSLVRGRKRENNNFLSIDTGIGAAIPVGMISYWFSGGIALVPALIAAIAGDVDVIGLQ